MQLFLEQVLHSAVLCLNQDSEEGLAMNLLLVHWFFLNAIQDIFSMDPLQLGVIQCLILWPSGMIPYPPVLVSSKFLCFAIVYTLYQN